MGLYLNPNADAPDGCAGPVYAFRLTNLEPGIGYRVRVSNVTGGGDYRTRCRSKADSAFYTSELDGLLEEGLGITGAGLFKEETDDMRYLQSLYRQERGDSIDNTAAYIFILPKASVDGVKGDMPLTRPVGYVFASGDTYADGQTIAHELGHGLYSFQHAFDYMGVSQGETDNLMDYGLPQGEHLAVWQWNLISTHKNYTIPFLTDDEDGWISLTSAPQLVEKGNSPERVFYEKLINEMFDLNKEKYPEDFYSALMDLRNFVLGKEYLKFDFVIQYLYFTAGENIEFKKAARDYALASAIILTTANNYKLQWGEKNEFFTGDEYDETKAPQKKYIILKKEGQDTMNFIALNKISGIKKWDAKGTLSDYYKKIIEDNNISENISEPCSFYTLLHECVHALYYNKPNISLINNTMSTPNTCAGCLPMTDLGVITMKPDQTNVKARAALNEYHHFRREVTKLYSKKLNYDMAIKVENYFRVNLRKLDNNSEIYVRTSINHLGTIEAQEYIEGYYNEKTCFKKWWDKKKGAYPSYFMDINENLYLLTDDFVKGKLGPFGKEIRSNKKGDISKSDRDSKYWREKYEQINGKFKNIYDLK